MLRISHDSNPNPEIIKELRSGYWEALTIPENCIVVIREGETISLEKIRNGIVFIAAFWSGASLAAFKTLNKALAKLGPRLCPRIFFADTDHENAQRFLTEQRVIPAGGGETFWIKDGKVVFQLGNYRDDLEVVEGFCRKAR